MKEELRGCLRYYVEVSDVRDLYVNHGVYREVVETVEKVPLIYVIDRLFAQRDGGLLYRVVSATAIHL